MASDSYVSVPAQDFFDLLLPDLPGANPDTVRQELDRVMRDFFRGTGAWQDRFVPVNPLAAGEVRIDLNAELVAYSAPYKVGRVFTVWNGTLEMPQTALVRRYKLNTWPASPSWSSPHSGIVEFAGEAWDEDQYFDYQVSLYPEERSVSYPSWLWEDHSEAIRLGVLGRMQTQIQKPYSNPVEGRTHRAAYRAEVNRARAVADRGGTPSGASWTYPRTFA